MAGTFSPAGGGNPSGTNVNALAPVTSSQPSIGAPTNPLLPTMPTGQSVPGVSNPFGFSANGTPAGAPAPNPTQGTGMGGGGADLARGFRDAGVPSDLANALAAFIHGGSGYNPQVLQAIFASLQPQIQRGEADINEHFGSMGLGMSSPAAIGLGDFLSQVNLNEGQIAAQLYEQSVQNYLQVLLGGSKNQSQDSPGFWQGFGEKLLSQAGQAGMSWLTGKIPTSGGSAPAPAPAPADVTQF